MPLEDVRRRRLGAVRERTERVAVVVGAREAEEKKVAMRRLGGEKQEFLALDAALATLINEARAPGQ